MDIFEELEDKMFNDNLIDSEIMNKLKFDSLTDLYKELKKERKCIVSNCENRSIKKSHAIQKSGSLKVISDDSHVLQPYFDGFANEMTLIMKSIGIGDASTFPGFCKTHERLFSGFEEKNDIDTIQEAVLQAYRSICREIVVNNIELRNSIKSVVKYKAERNKQAKLLLQAKVNKGLKDVNIQYDDYRLKSSNIAKVGLTEKIDFLNAIHNKFLAYMKNVEDNSIFMQVIKVDMCFPMALSGLGYANILEENIPREIKCVLNVVPFESSTILILASDLTHADALIKHWNIISQHPFSILNFIESFMVHGTDHWYIKPSIWNEMSEKKQNYILNYLFMTPKSFLNDLDFSIFDDIRNEFLDIFGLSEEFKEKEIRKLHFEFKPFNKTLLDSVIERYNDFYSKKDD